MKQAPWLVLMVPVLLTVAACAASPKPMASAAPASASTPRRETFSAPFRGLVAVFRSFAVPYEGPSTDTLVSNGTLLTIQAPAVSLATRESETPEAYKRNVALPSGGPICSSPSTCCRTHGGIWMDGRCL